MDNLDKEEYKELLKKIKKIQDKNNELLEMNGYLVECINDNFMIDDKGINTEETSYIKNKILAINTSIKTKLIPKIKNKLL